MGSFVAYQQPHQASSYDLDQLEQRLETLTLQTQNHNSKTSKPTSPNHDNPNLHLHRLQLYLSLIPTDLLPQSSSTIFLANPSEQTIVFLLHLEALWQAANFDEDVVLHYMMLAVAKRRSVKGEVELTSEDLEIAVGMMQREASSNNGRIRKL